MNDCIIWDGYVSKQGYGYLYADGRQWRAHRWFYKKHYGDFDESLLVCHKCDNRLCINPNHLFLGSQKDNIQDMLKKGRDNYLTNEENPHAKYSNESIKLIRMFLNQGVPQVEIAKAYGMSKAHVHRIKHNKQRNNINERF